MLILKLRCENSLLNFYGFDPTGIRDWNEELQICKDLPKKEFIQRINRDKALIKIQNDFLEASLEVFILKKIIIE